MEEAPARGKGPRRRDLVKLGVALAAVAVAWVLLWVSCRAGRRHPDAIGVILRKIERGSEIERLVTLHTLHVDVTQPAEFVQLFPYLIQATKDGSEQVHGAAASSLGGLILRFGRKSRASSEREPEVVTLCPEAAAAIAAVLDSPSASVRAEAARALESVATIGSLDDPPSRLVACLDDEAEPVRESAASAMVRFGKGPELLVPVALRWLSTEGPKASSAFQRVFLTVRFEPSVLPLLIDGLSSTNAEVCLDCTVAINHMGRSATPALPAILTLIRKELDTPHPASPLGDMDILAMASGAVGELWQVPPIPPGAVDLLCEVLKRENEASSEPDRSRPAPPVGSAKGGQYRNELTQAEAAFSLGILGRSAAPAVPVLLATFEGALASSDKVRETCAEALAEITRGTPDEDRLIATLADAWKAAPPRQKTVFARALRSLGSKTERRVPELRRFLSDGSRTEIRRFLYPRSDQEDGRRE